MYMYSVHVHVGQHNTEVCFYCSCLIFICLNIILIVLYSHVKCLLVTVHGLIVVGTESDEDKIKRVSVPATESPISLGRATEGLSPSSL